MQNTETGTVRLITLAVVNALVVREKTGHFIVELTRFEEPTVPLENRREIYLKARLDSGIWISCVCVLRMKPASSESAYPIEHFLLSFDEPIGPRSHRHFWGDISEIGIFFEESSEDHPHL